MDSDNVSPSRHFLSIGGIDKAIPFMVMIAREAYSSLRGGEFTPQVIKVDSIHEDGLQQCKRTSLAVYTSGNPGEHPRHCRRIVSVGCTFV